MTDPGSELSAPSGAFLFLARGRLAPFLSQQPVEKTVEKEPLLLNCLTSVPNCGTMKSRKREVNEMKFKRGDLVGRMSAGGFGEWSQSARPAVVVNATDGEYDLYLPGYSPNRETITEQFVAELSAEKRERISAKVKEVLAKLEKFNLQEWDPNYEIREALRAVK